LHSRRDVSLIEKAQEHARFALQTLQIPGELAPAPATRRRVRMPSEATWLLAGRDDPSL
jgi:hypothetical protein